MGASEPLPSDLQTRPGGIAVVLFSQANCEYCEEIRAHYLRPLLVAGRPGVTVAEAGIDSDRHMLDWSGTDVTQKAFGAANAVRFAPTVMFFDSAGHSLAPPIVGLSKDFFGSYLEQRIATALSASRAQAAR